MQLHEHECPACNLRLRMRGPLRDRQSFECPDCDAALHVRIDGVSCEVLLDQPATVVRPANSGSSSTPQIVAWSVVGILAVGFVAFLLSGSTESTSTESASTSEPDRTDAVAQQSDVSQEPAEPIAPPNVDKPSVEEPDVVADVPVVGEEDPEPEPNILPPPPTEPVQPPPPTKAEIAEAKRIAREQAGIAAVNQKLAIGLVKYATADSATVRSLLDEIATLSAVRIDRSAISEPRLDESINVVAEDCSLRDLLDQAARQVGLDVVVLKDGVRLQ